MAFKHIFKTKYEFIKIRNYCDKTFWSLKGRKALNKFPFGDIFSSNRKACRSQKAHLSFTNGSQLGAHILQEYPGEIGAPW